MSYELAIINPRSAPKRRRRATAKQLAWRKKFAARYGKGRKVRRNPRKRRKSPNHSGVSVMAKRRRRSRARNAKGHFIKGHKRRVRRSPRRKASASRRRRRAVGYVVGSGKIRRRKLNPRVSRRRRRRNPISLGSLSTRNIFGQLVPAAYGAGGAIALNLALSYLPLPDMLKTGIPKQVTRLAGAMLVGYAAQKFLGGERAKAIGFGALTVVVYDIVKGLIAMASPEIGARLGEFEDVTLEDGGFIDPASPVRGFAAYLEGEADDNGGVDGMSAYLQGDLDGNLDGDTSYDYA